MTTERINIELTKAQALVLFEWLARDESKEGFKFEDKAELQMLWILEGKLEKVLIEPFADNYKELLAKARDKVRDNPDG